MRLDPETDDIESSRPIPQDFDGPVEHPGVSTLRDDEYKKEKTSDETSIHSQSTNVVEPAPDGSEVLSRALSIVPRSRRRGLLGRFACIIPEVERPYEYKNSTKWFITFIIALAAAAAPMGSAIFLRMWTLFRYQNGQVGADDFDSCTSAVGNGLEYDANHHKSLSSYVYASHVNISPLVVFLLRDTRSQDYIPGFICAIHPVEYHLRYLYIHRHAYYHASSRRRGSSLSTSSRSWHDCGYLGSQRTR